MMSSNLTVSFPYVRGGPQVFIGIRQGTQHYYCFILVINLRKIFDNLIESIDMLHIETLLHLQLVEPLLQMQFVCEGLRHILTLQFRSYTLFPGDVKSMTWYVTSSTKHSHMVSCSPLPQLFPIQLIHVFQFAISHAAETVKNLQIELIDTKSWVTFPSF
jgi:hypothetical protein